ncbi:MAG: hypothetical protein H0T46_15150 [Deltaproteobacteria bacterium]|nr:hypothetical protein [Deltaproteobacteria bacterium]
MRALVVATVLTASVPVLAEPLVLARGEVAARLVIEANMDRRTIARPLSFAPDAWIGVTDRLTVGLIHSNQSVDRIAPGASFCVRELAGECDALYRGGGLDARWALAPGSAARVRLLMRDLDPVKPALTVGAFLRWQHGHAELLTDPYLRIGLANRDLGNRDALVVPVWIGMRTGGGRIAVHTGIDGDLAVWRDGWHVPLGIVIEAFPANALTVGTELGFTSLIGPQNNTKQAAAVLYIEWRGR